MEDDLEKKFWIFSLYSLCVIYFNIWNIYFNILLENFDLVAPASSNINTFQKYLGDNI